MSWEKNLWAEWNSFFHSLYSLSWYPDIQITELINQVRTDQLWNLMIPVTFFQSLIQSIAVSQWLFFKDDTSWRLRDIFPILKIMTRWLLRVYVSIIPELINQVLINSGIWRWIDRSLISWSQIGYVSIFRVYVSIMKSNRLCFPSSDLKFMRHHDYPNSSQTGIISALSPRYKNSGLGLT